MGLFSKTTPTGTNPFFNGTDWKLLTGAIDIIFETNFSSSHRNLYEVVVRSIHELSGACSVIIGRFDEENTNVNTLAFWDAGQLNPNFSYSLVGTPCANVVGKKPCSYLDNVAELFPDDLFFPERKIRSYIGIPLFYSERKPMGLMALMFDCPLANSEPVEMLLKVFSIRVVAEIEYQDYSQLLEAQNKELNLVLDQLKTKNKALDASILEVDAARTIAEESNSLKTAFLANLSHEVRTPMNVMLGFAELLKSEMLTHDERIEYIDIINQNGFQLLKIMDNLLEISKFQSRRAVESPNPFFLNQIIDRCYNNYCDYVKMMQKPIELLVKKDFDEGGDYVLADQEGVYKVLDQLIDNAVKFTKSGYIKFGYEKLGKAIRFEVRDTGIGVPEGMEEKIFDLFRQVDLRASREFGGNGLGLAIARKYSELMNGRVWVEHNVGGGACFYFEIPYRKASFTDTELSARN
jgi:signal transduction histidine kinase